MQQYRFSTFRIILMIVLIAVNLLTLELVKTDGLKGFIVAILLLNLYNLYDATHPPKVDDEEDV